MIVFEFLVLALQTENKRQIARDPLIRRRLREGVAQHLLGFFRPAIHRMRERQVVQD